MSATGSEALHACCAVSCAHIIAMVYQQTDQAVNQCLSEKTCSLLMRGKVSRARHMTHTLTSLLLSCIERVTLRTVASAMIQYGAL